MGIQEMSLQKEGRLPEDSLVRLTLLYIGSEVVIPAKAGIQIENTGFRLKPGMTIKVKGLLT
jgi:hypothetical protein